MKNTSLISLMNYKNEDVISRFLNLLDVSQAEAESIFNETKKFLFLSKQPGIFIPDELLILDEMWHNFILFTYEYHQFCEEYFGYYLHHAPATRKDKDQQTQSLIADPEKVKEAFHDKLSLLISTVYDVLGPETVVTWFKDYPEKYSKANIKAIRKN